MEAPQKRWVKLNIDGCFKEDRNFAGSGGILRGCNGFWVSGFSINIGVCSAIEELWEILHGLKAAWDKGIGLMEVETDSLLAYEWIVVPSVRSKNQKQKIMKETNLQYKQ